MLNEQMQINEQVAQNMVEEVATVTSEYSGNDINEEEAIYVEDYGYIHPDEVQDAIDDGILVRCYDCGDLILREDSHVGADDELYCESCWDDLFTLCEHCDHVMWRENATAVHDGSSRRSGYELWCERCVDDDAERCEHCDEYFSRDDMYEVHDVGWVCQDCYDDYDYVCCEECGEYFTRDAVEYDEDTGCNYCYDCLRERRNREIDRYGLTVRRGDDRVIHSYHGYDYELDFKGEQDRRKHLHLGVEVEMDKGGQNGTKARAIVEAGGYSVDTDVICMRDGSLQDGVEFISMPATLDYHRNEYGWDKMMARAIELGYRAHDVNTCGLHMHVDREFFNGAMTNPEEAFCILLNNNRWIKTFSRRTNWRYCNPYDAGDFKFEVDMFKGKDEALIESRKYMLDRMRRYYQGHSSALNFSNYGTIEVRIFKGTLKFTTFIASMQLVEMMAYAAKHFRLEQLCHVDYHWFKRFAEKRGYEEYLQYLKDRAILG